MGWPFTLDILDFLVKIHKKLVFFWMVIDISLKSGLRKICRLELINDLKIKIVLV